MGDSLYIYNNGRLSRKDNTLQFVNEDGEKRDLPIERVRDIYVMSEMQFNSSLINILAKNGIAVHFFNYYNFYNGSFYPREKLLSGNLLVQQTLHYIDLNKRMAIARKFVTGAANNIYRNLRYYNGRGKDLQIYMNDIEDYKSKIEEANTIQELMGNEGNIRKRYYEAWPIILIKKLNLKKELCIHRII